MAGDGKGDRKVRALCAEEMHGRGAVLSGSFGVVQECDVVGSPGLVNDGRGDRLPVSLSSSLSSRIVTGPSFTKCTAILAPKLPVMTEGTISRQCVTN